MELGSNYELSPEYMEYTEDTIFEYLKGYNSIYLNYGRSAIDLVLDILGFSGEDLVLMPDYLCESVWERFKNIRFYHVSPDFKIDMDDISNKIDKHVSIIYIMNYFGKLNDSDSLKKIERLKNKYNVTVIEDTTHSIFSHPCTIGDYCVCSLRKWFPVCDGAVLYSLNDMTADIQTNSSFNIKLLSAMILKHYQINNNVESRRIYRELFVQEEKRVDSGTSVKGISKLSEELLKCYSISELKRKRRENYNLLIEELGDVLQFAVDFDENDTPFCCPIYVDNRDDIRAFLTDKGIFCAVHWPINDKMTENAKLISNRIISLPIDQRYNRDHMEYMIETIGKCI